MLTGRFPKRGESNPKSPHLKTRKRGPPESSKSHRAAQIQTKGCATRPNPKTKNQNLRTFQNREGAATRKFKPNGCATRPARTLRVCHPLLPLYRLRSSP